MQTARTKLRAAGLAALALIVAAMLWIPPANAAQRNWRGEVVRVADGDTIEVRRGAAVVRVRLWGVDCPELRQRFGRAAKRFSTAKLLGKKVRVQVKDRDRYRRVVAKIITPGGRDHGLALLENGLAWWLRRFARHEKAYRRAQDRAKAQRAGLWTDPNPTPPWRWRKMYLRRR